MDKGFHVLTDEYLEAVESPENRIRGKSRVKIFVGMEEPICWHHLWGYDINRLFTEPDFYYSEALRQQLWRFKNFSDDSRLDGSLTAWMGHYPEYTYVGMTVGFSESGVPNIQMNHPLSAIPDLSLLKPVDFHTSGWMPRMLKWYEDIREIADNRLQVRFQTWWRGPLDMAIQLRGYENLMADTSDRPEFVRNLIGYLVEQRERWFRGYCGFFQCKMPEGFLGDDWLNVPFISPDFFEEFVLPAYLDIERYHGTLRHIHSCGNQTPIQKHLLKINSLASLEVSPWTDLEQTVRNLPKGMSLGVNLHPNDILFASDKEMTVKLRFINETCRGLNYVVATAGLTPILELSDERIFCSQVNKWLDHAREILE